MYAVYHAPPGLLDEISLDSGVAPVEAVAERDTFRLGACPGMTRTRS
jgi:hypothetical protein